MQTKLYKPTFLAIYSFIIQSKYKRDYIFGLRNTELEHIAALKVEEYVMYQANISVLYEHRGLCVNALSTGRDPIW